MEFDEEVERALADEVPAFLRSIARQRLEDFARQKGVERVTMTEFNEAKAKYFGDRA